MEKSFKIFGFITTNDETYNKLVTEVRVLLTVKTDEDSISGELSVRVPYNENIEFTNFEDLTEEQVMGWLDMTLINNELDALAAIKTYRPSVEAHAAPWTQPDLSKLASTLPTDLTLEEPILPHPGYFDLDAHIANLISKVLIEKGLAT